MASARNWDIAANTTLYAYWTANTYTVTFDKQSGTGGSDSVSATYGAAMPAATAPTRTGYTFGGYYTAAGGAGTQYYTAAMASARNWDIAANTTLYANWTANTYTVTANANGNGGGNVSSNPAGINYNYNAFNTGNAQFDHGTNVVLTASANASSTASWNDCAAAGGTPSGNGTATATCTFNSLSAAKTATATFSNDGNGVNPGVEDGGPNNGDGNGDGIRDSLQSNVVSLPSATGQGYITIVVSGGCDQLENVQALEASQGDDPNFNYPYGLVGFRLNCSSATVKIIYHGVTSLNGYTFRKYGPTPPNFNNPQCYTLPGVVFGQEVIGGQTVATATFTLNDGQLGDDTGVDEWIIDQGGPALPQQTVAAIPTMTEWGMILLMIFIGLTSIYSLRKRAVIKSH
jgi:uncharacterized repeat protein (TIGR02543 family)